MDHVLPVSSVGAVGGRLDANPNPNFNLILTRPMSSRTEERSEKGVIGEKGEDGVAELT